jgi:hypothetical protein
MAQSGARIARSCWPSGRIRGVQAYVSAVAQHGDLSQLDHAVWLTKQGLSSLRHQSAELYQQLAAQTWVSYRQLLTRQVDHIVVRASTLRAARRDIAALLPRHGAAARGGSGSAAPAARPLEALARFIAVQSGASEPAAVQAVLLIGMRRRRLATTRAAATALASAACAVLASVVLSAKFARDTLWRERLDPQQQWPHHASMLQAPMLAVLAWCGASQNSLYSATMTIVTWVDMLPVSAWSHILGMCGK